MYAYEATVLAVHDGDSWTAQLDLGFRVSFTLAARLAGCNARELAQPGGPEAHGHLASLLPVGSSVQVTSSKRAGDVDKWGGRYDLAVTLADGSDLVAGLIRDQWATAWDGQGTKPVPPWPRTIPTAPAGRALGRLVHHDPRSLLYPATQDAPVKSVRWARRSPILDQGDIGACTGNAAAGWLATDTATREGRSDVTEQTALEIYSKATHLDRVRGVYPPDDTGSSGLAVAKAMRLLGLTTGPYRHAFGLAHALSALQSGPVLVGMTWLTGCDTPDKTGLIRYSGSVRGGHEVLADEVDTDRRLIWFANSWGQWGKQGRFAMTWDDFGVALKDHGDVTVPS